MASIRCKPISSTRLAISTSGTPTTGSVIPVIEPKLTTESTEVKYATLRDSRYAAAIKRNLIYYKLTHKTPFYMPFDGATDAQMTAIVSLYDRLLLPAGTTATTGATGTAWTFSEDWSNYTKANIHYNEDTEIEAISGALCNLKLDFQTGEQGMTFENEWSGTYNAPITGSTYAFADHLSPLPVFQLANLYIWKLGDAKPTYYLPCKQYTFDAGNQVEYFDDCNGAYGVSGFMVNNTFDSQKVSFDCQMPYLEGTAIDATSFPWRTWWAAGELMEYEMTFSCGKTGTAEKTTTLIIKGVFQFSEQPDRSEDKNIRRIKIGGLCQKTSTRNAFDLQILTA